MTRISRRRRVSLAGSIALAAGCAFGCATTIQTLDAGPTPMGGVRLEAPLLAELLSPAPAESCSWREALLALACVIDLPLSAAADLICLPISIPRALAQGGVEVELPLGPSFP